jgi:hypothetical protein
MPSLIPFDFIVRAGRPSSSKPTRVTWEAVTAIATASTGCVILITAVVGVYQLRQLREQRRDLAATELMRSLQDTMFAQAFRLILQLPARVTADELLARGPDLEEAAQIVAFRFETFGLMVYRGAIAYDVMEELVGGATVNLWKRLESWIVETREKQNWPGYCEWFQWIAEQFAKRGRLEQTPAHVRLEDWTPPR